MNRFIYPSQILTHYIVTITRIEYDFKIKFE